jgi:hypothetical protein
MTALPHSPDELLNRLFTMFPRFKANYDGPIFEQPLSYDSVLTAFTSGRILPSLLSTQQSFFPRGKLNHKFFA